MVNKKIITQDEVLHIAELGKLKLSEDEIALYTEQLAAVLDYIDKLQKVNTATVVPTYQTLDNTKNVFREDEIKPGLNADEAVSQSSRVHNNFFVTKGVFDDTKSNTKDVKTLPQRKKIDKYNAVLTEVDAKGNLGHKDLFMTKGIETTAGSKVLQGYIAQYTSTVATLLETAGYKTKYKLNQDAWGHGSSGENSDFGPTLNPWDEKRVAGGSSSGSAVAVAIGDVDIATGTDTCGSIRMPSSFTNVCGIKPTYGALSRFGVIAFASSLDCPGLFARDVASLRKAFSAVSKEDAKDATSQSIARNSVRSSKVKTLGFLKDFLKAGVDVEIKKALLNARDQFTKLGFKIVDISLPHAMYGIAVYYIIAPTETSSNLGRYDGIRYGNTRAFFGSEAKRRIMLGTFASSKGYADKYYEKAARVRTLIIEDFNKSFKNVDAIISPVSPTPAFLIGEKVNDPLKMYLSDIFMAPVSLSGLPSLALPCGFTKTNLPIGMQIIGPRWQENLLFDLGEKYQKVTDWHTKRFAKN
jgi:aspartyl-tRNA(Asn)/glutamyl-tRNA(Gln) amidotransferase subunit A